MTERKVLWKVFRRREFLYSYVVGAKLGASGNFLGLQQRVNEEPQPQKRPLHLEIGGCCRDHGTCMPHVQK